jgi:hypothetical protein
MKGKVLAPPEFSGVDRVKNRKKEEKEPVFDAKGIFAHVLIVS